jgi:hypothetical protein
MYDKYEDTKGRVMLVDSDLLDWFARDYDPLTQAMPMPERLAEEYDAFIAGRGPGSGLRQEELYARLQGENAKTLVPMCRNRLVSIHRDCEVPGEKVLCYCGRAGAQLDKVEEVVVCEFRNCPYKYFHKRCVTKLGTEAVSRWYCTGCELQMKVMAYEVTGL